MAKSEFIPELWAAQFLRSYEAETVISPLVSRLYEAELQGGPGDRVKIPEYTLSPTIRDYTVDTNIMAAQVADGDQDKELELDKQKYWHVYVDDIDRVQSAPDIMAETIRVAAREMAEQIEDDLLVVFADDDETNDITSATTNASGVTDAHIDEIITLAMKMDMANVPKAGRWLVVNPLYMGRLRKYLTDTGGTGRGFTPTTDEAMLRRGEMGNLMGFRLIQSNRVPITTGTGANAEYNLYAGVGQEVFHAMQITQMESYRPELRFGTAVKALLVYGTKKLRPLYGIKIKGNAI